MMARRIIPCLDLDKGQVVKGVRFQHLRRIGDPVELARRYAEEGADEIVCLDISATLEGRAATLSVVTEVARQVSVPLTVGGGIRTVEDARAALRAGADKVAVNSAAVADPTLLQRLADAFGSQSVVLAVDAKRGAAGWEVMTHAGKRSTGRDAVAWCREGIERGAGEILLTSMDQDGTRGGYDLALIAAVARAVDAPVIASGGAGKPEHLLEAARAGADAVLAASIFHEGRYRIGQVKRMFRAAGLAVRLDEPDPSWLEEVRWDEQGRVPVVVESEDGVRMLGYADREALRRTMESGELWLFSRSRQSLWRKGESSGNVHRVVGIDLDCDGDAVRVRVKPQGPTCHTGSLSCFDRTVWESAEVEPFTLPSVLRRLEDRIEERLRNRPAGSYVSRLASDPTYARRKVGEEAVEWILATETLDSVQARREAVHEAADLLFHWLVLLRVSGLTTEEVAAELASRDVPSRPSSEP